MSIFIEILKLGPSHEDGAQPYIFTLVTLRSDTRPVPLFMPFLLENSNSATPKMHLLYKIRSRQVLSLYTFGVYIEI